MPIHQPRASLDTLGTLAELCTNPSLLQDRFVLVDHSFDEATFIQAARLCTSGPDIIKRLRQAWILSLNKEKRAKRQNHKTIDQLNHKLQTTASYDNLKPCETFLPPQSWQPKHAHLLCARLNSRMVVNISGGVSQNANIHLNRYGIPTIPGSAIKGCARRMALQALHDWIDHAQDPDNSLTESQRSRPHPDDPSSDCCDGFTSFASMLVVIAQVFGWVEQDWDHNSDFAWATHKNQQILLAAQKQLLRVPSFAGSVAFLEAYPNVAPDLELDVLTPHHTKYYQGNPGFEGAPDTESPVPVFFPAVRPQSGKEHYIFPLVPLPRHQAKHLDHARNWLMHGLSLLGIGAKTAAGYGYFKRNVAAEEQLIKAAQLQLTRKTVTADSKQLEWFRELHEGELHEKKQLAATINQFAYDNNDTKSQLPDELNNDPARLALLHIMQEFEELRQTKKGKKAFALLCQKFPDSCNLDS